MTSIGSHLQRARRRAVQLHWVQWLVICLSLTFAFSVWRLSAQQARDAAVQLFDRDARTMITLIQQHVQISDRPVRTPTAMKSLVDNTLATQRLGFAVRITDDGQTLYDGIGEVDDVNALTSEFQMSMTIPVDGRAWTFEVWSLPSYRSDQYDIRPLIMLVGGVVTNALLISAIVLLARANKRNRAVLDQMMRTLQERNEELEQFVYTASHDLKSPLLTIHGFTGFLEQDIAEGRADRLHEFAERIREGASRMRANVDDLLELSRIGRVVGEMRTVQPATLVSQLVAEMDNQLDAADATVDVQEDIPSLTCDPERLHQIFANLLANAIKYGRPEHHDLHIKVGGRVDGDEVHLFVADNGPGIPPEYHAKVFGLFERLKTDVDGTGLGLAIVKRVAEIHGGRAWVESVPGAGATFHIALPRHVVNPARTDDATQQQPG